MSPLFNPHNLQNPYADAYGVGALPAETKLETAPPTGYDMETKGLRAENFQTIIRNNGELETQTQTGQYYVKSQTVTAEEGTYQQDITYVDLGAGETGLIPVLDAPAQEEGYDANAEIYEEAQYQHDTSSVEVETGANYDPYNGQDSFYTNESGTHFIDPVVQFYPVDPNVYDFGQNFETY